MKNLGSRRGPARKTRSNWLGASMSGMLVVIALQGAQSRSWCCTLIVLQRFNQSNSDQSFCGGGTSTDFTKLLVKPGPSYEAKRASYEALLWNPGFHTRGLRMSFDTHDRAQKVRVLMTQPDRSPPPPHPGPFSRSRRRKHKTRTNDLREQGFKEGQKEAS